MRLHRNNVVAVYHNVFNWKLAATASIFVGLGVLWINRHYGPAEYLYAGGWQAVLQFFSSGITTRVAQHLATIRRPLPAYTLGSGVPALMTFAFSAGVHWLNGTPEFLASCLWPTFVSASTSLCMNYMMRNRALLPDWKWVRLGMKWIVPKNHPKE